MSTVLSSIYHSVLSSYSSLGGRRPFQSSVADPVYRYDDHHHHRDLLLRDNVASEIMTREGGGEGEVSSSIAEAESTLAECASSLVAFDGRERFLGERIARYRMLMGRREGIIRELESEGPASTNRPPHDDDDDDLENAQFDDDARKCRLEALRARHSADGKSLRCLVELHKDIIAEMETMRRRMDDLVEKRDDIVEKLEECRDYLIEAADRDDTMRREDG
jgi:hypothetical protein